MIIPVDPCNYCPVYPMGFSCYECKYYELKQEYNKLLEILDRGSIIRIMNQQRTQEPDDPKTIIGTLRME
jgi:hypothetical protein